MTGHDFPAAMRASDGDRDAVVSDLGEHCREGRLTAAELDERIGQALSARTYGELRQLLADLPATGSAGQAPVASSPASGLRPPSGRLAPPPLVAAVAGIAIAALVLGLAHAGWGLIWLIVPVLVFARRSICH